MAVASTEEQQIRAELWARRQAAQAPPESPRAPAEGADPGFDAKVLAVARQKQSLRERMWASMGGAGAPAELGELPDFDRAVDAAFAEVRASLQRTKAAGEARRREAFEAEVARYNELAGSPKDADLGEDLSERRALEGETFWMLPLVTATSKSLGGAVLDEGDFTVLDAEGAPVPGLYAVGEAAGILGGVQLGLGFNGSITAVWWTGRTAADAIATKTR